MRPVCHDAYDLCLIPVCAHTDCIVKRISEAYSPEAAGRTFIAIVNKASKHKPLLPETALVLDLAHLGLDFYYTLLENQNAVPAVLPKP